MLSTVLTSLCLYLTEVCALLVNNVQMNIHSGSEVVFKFDDVGCFNQHPWIDAFELEYDFVHVRAFTYILS